MTNVVGLLLALLGTTTETKHQMEGGLLLNIVVTEGATILELLSCKDQTLLVRRNAEVMFSQYSKKDKVYLTPPCLGFWP